MHDAGHLMARLPHRTPMLEGPLTQPLPTPVAAAAHAPGGFGMAHHGVVCDGCASQPIVGMRHKALWCEDFDLCESCLRARPDAGATVAIRSPLAEPVFEFPPALVAAAATAAELAAAAVAATGGIALPPLSGGDVELPAEAGDREGSTPSTFTAMRLALLRRLHFRGSNTTESIVFSPSSSAAALGLVPTTAEDSLEATVALPAGAVLQAQLAANDDTYTFEFDGGAGGRGGYRWEPDWELDVFYRPSSSPSRAWTQLGSLSHAVRQVSAALPFPPGDVFVGVRMRVVTGRPFPNIAHGKRWQLSPSAVALRPAGVGEWFPPLVGTQQHAELYIDLDLLSEGTVLYIASAGLRLLPPPASLAAPRRRLRLRLFCFGAYEFPSGYSATAEEDASGVVTFPDINQGARLLRIELLRSGASDVQLTDLHVHAELPWANTLLGTFHRAFTFHASKPLCGTRPRAETAGTAESAAAAAASERPFAWRSYSTVWARVKVFARGLHALIGRRPDTEPHDVGVALMAQNSEEWLVACFACWCLGRVVVAVPTTTSAAQLPAVLRQGKALVLITDRTDVALPNLAVVVTIGAATAAAAAKAAAATTSSFDGVERSGNSVAGPELPQQLPPEAEDRPALLLFTSGSSGVPKGVARSFRELHLLLRTYATPQRSVHLSVQPLSHLSEGVVMPTIIIRGGQIGFTTMVNMQLDVLGDMRALQPTFIFSVPRLFELAHALFDDAVKQKVATGVSEGWARAETIQLFRSPAGPFGGRICVMSVGSAPVTPQLFAFLSEVWSEKHGGPASVGQGYGSTECGTISVDNRIWPSVRVLLVERQDLNRSFDSSRPCGELLVTTPMVVSRYSAGEASGVVVDGAPYFRPGDLCDTDTESFRSAAGHGTCGSEWGDLVGRRFVLLDAGAALEVVGRVKHCQKLSNGEFVSPEAIEASLAKADAAVISTFIVVLDSARDRVVALVVPHDLALGGSAAAEARVLAAFRRLGASAGLATHEIPTAVAVLGEAWSPQTGTMTSSNKVDRSGIKTRFAEDLRRLGVGAREVVGGAKRSIDSQVFDYLSAQGRDAAMAALGGGSATDISDDVTLEALGGDSVAAARIAGSFTGRLTIAQVISLKLSELRHLLHGASTHGPPTSVGPTPEYWAAEAAWGPPASIPAARPPTTTRRALLLTGVTGFIGPHLMHALAHHGRWQRIVALVRAPIERSPPIGIDLPLEFELEVVAADMGRPGLALRASDRRQLMATVFDAVVHSAAHVDHIHTYEQMRAANVDACDELVHLTASSRPRFVYVSSVSATSSGAAEDLASVPAAEVTKLGGYGQTKWVSERRLAAAAQHGLLRSLCICRLGLIGPHSSTAEANASDWVQLFLQACLTVQAAPTMPADACVSMLPVDTTVRALTLLAADDGSTGTHVVQLDAQAVGVFPCPIAPLLSAAGANTWPRPRLRYSEWHRLVRTTGGAAEKALAVLPAPSELVVGQAFELPSALRNDLQRSGVVAELLGAPLQERDCYLKAEFQQQWATRVVV